LKFVFQFLLDARFKNFLKIWDRTSDLIVSLVEFICCHGRFPLKDLSQFNSNELSSLLVLLVEHLLQILFAEFAISELFVDIVLTLEILNFFVKLLDLSLAFLRLSGNKANARRSQLTLLFLLLLCFHAFVGDFLHDIIIFLLVRACSFELALQTLNCTVLDCLSHFQEAS